MWASNVLSSPRIILVTLFHAVLAGSLTAIYGFTHEPAQDIRDMHSDFLADIKDYVDLCVTGIVFLLSAFVTTQLTRWWTIRTQCVGGLWNAIANLQLITSSMYPTASAAHREARDLVSRYGLLAFQLLFLEAQAPESPISMEASVRMLESRGLLRADELAVLQMLPCRANVVIAWLTQFFEDALSPASTMACAKSPTNCDNGRYSTIFGQLQAARSAINLTNSHLTCQLPYGYVHLILLIVHVTCLANSLYCGIQLGCHLRDAHVAGASAYIWLPIVFTRILRIIFLPIMLDGMLLIGTVIANPLGDDADDFPMGAYLEELEDECLAISFATESFHPKSLMLQKKKDA